MSSGFLFKGIFGPSDHLMLRALDQWSEALSRSRDKFMGTKMFPIKGKNEEKMTMINIDDNNKNAPYEVLFVTKGFKEEIDSVAASMGIDLSRSEADYDEFIEKALRCGMRHEEVKSKWLKSSPIEPPRDALDNVLNLAARVNKATSQRLPKDAPRSLEDNGDGTMSLLWSSGTGRGFDRCTTFQLMGEGEFAPLKITDDPLPETHSEKLVREAAAREIEEAAAKASVDPDHASEVSKRGAVKNSAFELIERHHISPHNRPATRPAPAAELLGLCGLNTKVKDLEEKFDGIANSLAFVLKFSHQLSMVPNLQDRIIQEGNEVARIDERQIGLENRIRDKIRVLDSIAEELEKINAEIDDLSTRARTQASVNLSNSDSNSRLWSIVDILCQRLDNIESTLHPCT